MNLSATILGSFTIGSLVGLMLGAAFWKSDNAKKSQSETSAYLANSASHEATPNPTGIKEPIGGETPKGKEGSVARAKAAFLALGKIGSSRFSSIQGGPAFASAMMSLSGFTSVEYAAWLGELSSMGLRDEEMVSPLIAWSTVDAKAALHFAVSDKNFQGKENILAMVVHELAKKDLVAAGAVVDKMEKDEKTKCQTAMVVALFDTNRAAAARLANEFGDDRTSALIFQLWAEDDLAAATAAFGAGQSGQEETAWELARSVLSKDPVGYKAWVDSLQGSVASAAHARVVLSLIETDAASGAAALQRILTQDPTADKFCRSKNLAAAIVNQWWKSAQPQEIATWATSLTGGTQEQAVSDVAREWTRKNSIDASVWIKSLPNGNARDAAVAHLINAIRDDFPTDALQWARSISNPEQQAKALKSIKPTTTD